MEDLWFLRAFGFVPGLDLAAILAFALFGIVSFLAPVIGYRPERSPGVTASLFLLVGYGAVAVIQLIVQWNHILDSTGSGTSQRRDMLLHTLLAFTLLKLILFVVAMLCFALGLRSYRVRGPGPVAEAGASPDRGGM